MLDIIIPKTKFDTGTYPNLESRADGMVIPYRYGQKANITPICIDTTTLKFKTAGHAIKEIVSVKADGETLTTGTDYSEDLANGEFTIKGTPLLAASTTYYLIWDADYAVSAAHYLKISVLDPGGYAGGQGFEIDGGDAWTGQTYDIEVRIYGKASLDGDEEIKIDTRDDSAADEVKIRDAAARTKIAQSFTTGGSAWYITRVLLYYTKTGTPTGNLHLEIHSDQAGTQVGCDSVIKDVSEFTDWWGGHWPQRGTPSEVLVEIKGRKNADTTLMDQVDDILEDVCETIVGIASADLDDAALATLAAARTEAINPQLESEISFGSFLERLEVGQLFKFVPQLDGTYAPIVYAAGTPAGTPHLRDEDFLSFRMYRDYDGIKQTVRVKYNMNPTSQQYSIAEATSSLAQYGYKNEETMEVETYLRVAANASTLASSYLSLIEIPQLKAEFELRGTCLDKIPTDKVKITRTRACYSGGTLSAVLFRILSITKTRNGDVRVTALLDSQSY